MRKTLAAAGLPGELQPTPALAAGGRCVKLSLERKIALGFGSAIFVLLLVTTAAWWNVARFRGTQFWVERSREVLSNLEQALSDVLSMQASTRGFVLTGSDDVLVPFNTGSAHLDATLRELRRLTADNPTQGAELARLEPLAVRARAVMADRQLARRTRGLDAASETAAYLEGQRAVEDVRRLVRQMVTRERETLDDRLDRNNRLARLMVLAMIAASLVAIGAVAIAARVVHRDFQRRREAEQALAESFRRVEDLYNRAPCGYHSLDQAGTFVAINDTALRWLGYTREEVVGRMKFAEVLAPASAAVFEERFRHFIRVGAVENVEYEWRRKDGTTFPVLLNATAVYDGQGRYQASRATVFDVTLRRRAEEERDRFFTISRDLLCIAGFDGSFKRLNPAWEVTLGFSSQELQARPFLDFVHPADREQTGREADRLMQGSETLSFENRYQCKDGSFRWLLWSARAVSDERLIYGSARDITERKNAEESIRRLHDDLLRRAGELEAANRELESFSYSVSHDLRAPLRHIDGFASLLGKHAEETLDDEARRYIKVISKSARQMGRLIDDLLAFSRIGRAPLRWENVDHDQLVAGVIADGQYDTAERKICWALAPLPRVRGDAAMLRQVWVNLIDNAVKYSSKLDDARIAIAGQADATAGEYVFSVRDNGVGFDMAYADKLFGVFQRLHGPTEFEGTGIGLANVRRIVARHGGRTWADSRVNEGATFYFSIPVHLPIA